MRNNSKNLVIILIILLIGLEQYKIRCEDYFVHEILDCITKEKCTKEYKACAEDESCSAIINAQSGCRYKKKCNLNSKILWDPNCYIGCIQETDYKLYLTLTECSRSNCHAYSNVLSAYLYSILTIIAFIYFI